MALGWASQESCLDRKLVGHVVTHVTYNYKFEAAPVRPKGVITYLAEDGALSDLCPSIQVPKLAALPEVSHQVNKDQLCKYIHHTMAPQAPGVIQIHVKIPKYNVVQALKLM